MTKSKRIRIVHLITSLDIGGAEAMLVKLVTNMDRERFENIVVNLTKPGPLTSTLRDGGIPTFALNLRRGRANPCGIIQLFRLLRRATILQTWLYHSDLLGLLAGSFMHTPCIIWNLRCSNMDMSEYPLHSRLVLKLLPPLSRLPAMVVANSQAAMVGHRNLGYRPKAWCVIPNGFDTTQFQFNLRVRAIVRHELGIADSAILIGMPARFDPMKDHSTFFQAAGILASADPRLRFVAVGSGMDHKNSALSKMVRSNGLWGKTLLLGERRDMPRVLNAFDIAVLSSAFGEGFPNVLGEAMATEVPCVATAVGDVPLIIGETGKVVPPREPYALARAVREYVEVGADARRLLGRAARQRIIDNYSLEAVVRKYEELFSTLANKDCKIPPTG